MSFPLLWLKFCVLSQHYWCQLNLFFLQVTFSVIAKHAGGVSLIPCEHHSEAVCCTLHETLEKRFHCAHWNYHRCSCSRVRPAQFRIQWMLLTKPLSCILQMGNQKNNRFYKNRTEKQMERQKLAFERRERFEAEEARLEAEEARYMNSATLHFVLRKGMKMHTRLKQSWLNFLQTLVLQLPILSTCLWK